MLFATHIFQTATCGGRWAKEIFSLEKYIKLCKKRKTCIAKGVCAINITPDTYNCKQFHKALEEKFPSPNIQSAASELAQIAAEIEANLPKGADRFVSVDVLDLEAWARQLRAL